MIEMITYLTALFLLSPIVVGVLWNLKNIIRK